MTPTSTALDAVWEAATGTAPAPGADRLDLLPPDAAVRFLVEVEAGLDLSVPFECFFREGLTVRDLPTFLRQRTASSQLVVPVQPAGHRPPLFFVHGDEYAMLSLRHFVPALGREQPLVGLLPQRHNRRFDRQAGMAGMVPGLLEALRTVQPRGPYHLCGHSLGGVIVYEMAGRLAAEGEDVAWLAMADTRTPDRLRRFYADLMSPLRRLLRLLRNGPVGMTAKAREVAGRRLPGRGRDQGVGANLPEAAFDHAGVRAVYEASHLVGHGLPVDLYATTAGVQMATSDYLGWDELHRGILTRHAAPGDHLTMLVEPNVTALARMMASRLAQVGRWQPATPRM
jgi:thioesterase domain-containing protein